MSNVAVLGLGAMGARMAANLLKAGHTVAVWNRTVEKNAPLVALGAQAAPTPRAAVEGADYAIAVLRDDEASRLVWSDQETGALVGLRRHAVAIESSTLSVGWVRELSRRCGDAGVPFIDAPVAGSRPQAEAGQLVYLVGGDPEIVARSEPLLKAMGSAVHHAGACGAGTVVKLTVNALLGIQVAAMAELVQALRKSGVDVARAIEIVTSTAVCSPAAKVAATSMLAGSFAPMFPVELIEKDFGYALAAAEASGAATPLTTAAYEVFAKALRDGLAEENMTAVVRLYG